MIIHSTVITQRGTVKLTRQEIRPTDHPLRFVLCIVSLSVFIFLPSNRPLGLPPRPKARGELTPGYMQTATVLPRASHKLTELYYADPALSLCPTQPPLQHPPRLFALVSPSSRTAFVRTFRNYETRIPTPPPYRCYGTRRLYRDVNACVTFRRIFPRGTRLE